MKKTIYSVFGLLLLAFAGCTKENIPQTGNPAPEEEETAVRFAVNVPEYKTVFTRANGGVNDLHLLVFDENGIFIVRKQATLSGQTATGGTFTATLPSSTHKRIVHFVCNYDWTGFDESAQGANEAAAVALMSTTNATFWARQVLDGGINETCFNGVTVELLRNRAKISVSNEASNFTLTGFAIHQSPDKGSVAPFNRTTLQFQQHAITEPIGMGLTAAVQSDIDPNEKYLFERRNQNAEEITTVIVQGQYNGASYFYKIDLIDANKVRYDIERNYHYVVKIRSVLKEGYTSFTDALAGASHNNTALDPIIEKYPMISDGISKLEVEKTLVILTQPNQSVTTWAKYYPDLNDDNFDNSGVTVSVTQNAGEEAINPGSLSFNPSTGAIALTGASTVPTTPYTANISVQKGDLARTIRVILRSPYSFNPITINDLPHPAVITNGQNQNATLRFFIPNDFPEDLFPLPVKIYTQGLYPAAAGLQMFVEGGVIHYVYKATTRGQQMVSFKTNKSGNDETVTIEADYFTNGTIRYRAQ